MVNVKILKFRDNMKKINIVLIALAAVVLTGCKSLYGKYERPDVKADGLFRDPVSVMDTLAVNDTLLSFPLLPLLLREQFLRLTAIRRRSPILCP